MYQPPYFKSDPASERAVGTISGALLGKTARVLITDERSFVGTFVCVDSEMNVILQRAQELSETIKADEDAKRWVGLVMVPGHHVIHIEIDDSLPTSSSSVSQSPSAPGFSPVNGFLRDVSHYS